MPIYEQLYDVVSGNLREAGETFSYYKTTFLSDVGNAPQVIDVSQYLELSNEQFYQALFVAAFKRLPEEKEESRWRKRYHMPAAEFQKKVLVFVANASVVAINHIRLVNNPYFVQRRGIRYRMMGMLYGLTDKSSLRELGKKLPQPIQRVIRKVFL